MDAIIRIIIKIFQEIFEKDSTRRQQEAARRAEILRQWQLKKQGIQPSAQRQPVARPRSASPGQPQQLSLLERMDSIISEMANPRPAPPPPPPKMRPKPSRPAAKPIGPEPTAELEFPQVKARKGGKWKLPGSTPLEQMMYAKVILDPCLAIEEERRGF